MMKVTVQELQEQLGIRGSNPSVGPEGFDLMVAEPVLFAVQFVYPRSQLVFDLLLRPVAQFPLGPVAVSVFLAFQKLEKREGRSTCDPGGLL